MDKERAAKIRKIISREYKIYKEEEELGSLPRTLYEKACRISAALINVKPDKKTAKKLDEVIEFSHLKITPAGVMSLTILFILLTMVPSALLVALSLFTKIQILPYGYGILTMAISLFLMIYIYNYPFYLKRRYETEVSSEIVTMILYMAMYMRNNPNLEGAVRFASENLSGPIGLELKKMLWDVEVGNYFSMQEALIAYTEKWAKNREFVEAVELLITSTKQVGEKRVTLLDETVNIVLEGNREQARHFNQKLRLPVMVVHALGVILPVMGLVMFPIVSVFLGVETAVLFVGYDILLPMALYFVILRVSEMRPATFSRIDISENPDVPPQGKVKAGKRFVSVWPIAALSAVPFIGFGLWIRQIESEGIYSAVIILMGIAVGVSLYYILLSRKRMEIRNKTRKTEGEFAEALFQLGSQISSGTPIEISIENSMDRISNLEIKNLFSKALKNMKSFGMTFQQSFFDKDYGAIKLYPSRLIKNIMKTVVESSKKGVNVASISMISMSRYLKGMHATQEDVREELSETVNSLKFQLYFLSPMISGIVVTLAIIIIRILKQLSTTVGSIQGVSVPFLSSFANITVTPFQFIIVVGVYIIETCVIISMFINNIENGDDSVGRMHTTGYSLLVGFIMFAIFMFVTLAVFGPLITTLL
ncbi:MAG: type II secretion system F family protein [Candidatus Aenigmarchaeota archaeon]|nr:type II secretion system F family protein [Candidatus Aenigmarchaeota archaeon]MDI6721943.1 type II secretion system F family protein [Candidatus Aenigmarchaeota archaeon]